MGGYNSCKDEARRQSESVATETMLPDDASVIDLLGGESLEQAADADTQASTAEGRIFGKKGPRGMDMYAPFRALIEKLISTRGVRAKTIASCYESGSTASYRVSSDPETLGQIAPEQYAALIQREYVQGNPLFIIGHSHGGWTALQSTLDLGGRIAVNQLYSIDPISRVHCRPPAIFGCESFPADIGRNEQAAIAANSGQWINSWQNRTLYLHSGKAQQADANHKYDVGHTSIDTHDPVWDQIENQILGYY